MTEQKRPGVGEGIREGIGILTAFKEAVEETVEEALAQGDLSSERARAVMREAADRLQQTVEEARDRFEPVPRREFEELRRHVEALRTRLEALEKERGADASAPPAISGSEETGFPIDG